MEVSKGKILDIFKNRTVEIPVYQRNYVWGKDKCERLFDDFEKAFKEDVENYFIGCSVIVSDENDAIQLIDGQQRVTTISLLLLAICNLLKLKKIKSLDEDLKDEIWEDYLVNKREWKKYLVDNDNKFTYIRLKQTNQDDKAYKNLVAIYDNNPHKFDNDPELKQTPIYKNYEYLKKRIIKFCKNNDIDDFWKFLNTLEYAKILLQLKHGDKPQVVFETINGTGESLEDADLIRNYILMDRDEETQKIWFNNYWKPIEENTYFTVKDEHKSFTTEYVWYYLIYLDNNYFVQNKTYITFKKHIVDLENKLGNKQQKNARIEKELKELLRFSKS